VSFAKKVPSEHAVCGFALEQAGLEELYGFAHASLCILRTGGLAVSKPQVIHGHFGKSPAKKRTWKQILCGTYESLSEDRVLAVAAGVTFYGLLALFPAVAALVSLYGLFADPEAIRTYLDQLSSVLPGGAVEVIGDQIKRVASAGSGTLGFSSAISIAIAVWGANAGVKAMFDALNVAYGAKEERSFFKLNLISLAFTIGAIAFAILALIVNVTAQGWENAWR
jgi:membrane protein